MSKRGRPPLSPEQRRNVKLTIWVREDVADGMFRIMNRNRQHLSEWAADQFERVVNRDKTLSASQIKEIPSRVTH